jgi:hypothetical protein
VNRLGKSLGHSSTHAMWGRHLMRTWVLFPLSFGVYVAGARQHLLVYVHLLALGEKYGCP